MAKFCTRVEHSGRKSRPNRALTWLSGLVAVAGGGIFFLSMQLYADAGPAGRADGIEPGIIWYGVLKDGLAEAEETGKPILLVSAAPNCVGISGLW